MQQETSSHPPRIIQENIENILHETLQGSSAQLLQGQGCDLTHSITAFTQMRNCRLDCAFSITCLVVVEVQSCILQRGYPLSFDFLVELKSVQASTVTNNET